MKHYKLSAVQIRPLARGHGGCLATDMITLQGLPVGYGYREAPVNELDSGWRFLSGLESDDDMDVAGHHRVYDVNTIANYDPDIIPLLQAPVGSAFERVNGQGGLVPVDDENPPGGHAPS